MAQRIMEQALNEFYKSMPVTPPGLADPFSSEAQPFCTSDEDKNGTILIHDNQIFVTPPLPGGKPARISALHPVLLTVNGHQVIDPTEVNSFDRIAWQICEKPQYQIAISEDRLRAYFILYKTEKYAWKLVNCPASACVTVRAEPDRELVLSTLTVEQIITGFNNNFFIRNLNISALYAELCSPTYLPVCISAGKAPIPGKDGRLQLLIQRDYSIKEPPSNTRYYPEMTYVRKGEIIGRVLLPEEGVPGFDVYGGILPAPAPRSIQLVTKQHIAQLPNGEIAALAQGRPRVTGIGSGVNTIDLPDVYIVPETFDRTDGPILFAGDVIAPSDIGPDVIIEALGSVYIYGNLRNSKITATGSIMVRGVIENSELYSGSYGVINHRLCKLSKLLMKETHRLREASRTLAETVQSLQHTVKYNLVVMLLLESKYRQIPNLIVELQNALHVMNTSNTQDVEQLRHLLKVFLHPGEFTEFITDDALESFLKELNSLYEGIAAMQEAYVAVDITNARDSIIKSAGPIHIHQGSIVQCRIASDGDILFKQDGAVCEASSLEAAGSITAQHVYGSQTVRSVLRAGKQITARQINNCAVTIEEISANIVQTAENAVFTVQSLQKIGQPETQES